VVKIFTRNSTQFLKAALLKQDEELTYGFTVCLVQAYQLFVNDISCIWNHLQAIQSENCEESKIALRCMGIMSTYSILSRKKYSYLVDVFQTCLRESDQLDTLVVSQMYLADLVHLGRLEQPQVDSTVAAFVDCSCRENGNLLFQARCLISLRFLIKKTQLTLEQKEHISTCMKQIIKKSKDKDLSKEAKGVIWVLEQEFPPPVYIRVGKSVLKSLKRAALFQNLQVYKH